MQSEIKRWGNSAAVRLSSKILAQARLDVASPISIDVKAGKIIIEAARTTTRKVNLPFSEAELWSGLMPMVRMKMSLRSLRLRKRARDGGAVCAGAQ